MSGVCTTGLWNYADADFTNAKAKIRVLCRPESANRRECEKAGKFPDFSPGTDRLFALNKTRRQVHSAQQQNDATVMVENELHDCSPLTGCLRADTVLRRRRRTDKRRETGIQITPKK
jgi:hypothetical protein